MNWRWSWKRNLFWIALITMTGYAIVAYVGNAMAENSRAGCERGNDIRRGLYRDTQSRIIVDTAVRSAVQAGPNAQRVQTVMTRDIEKAGNRLDDLTLSPGTREPWNTDCEAAYPNPLPRP